MHSAGRLTIRILVVDDHRVVRDGLRQILRPTPELEIVGEAGSGEEALGMIDALHPDLLLLDISLPDISGLEVLKRLRQAKSPLPVLIFSMHPADQYAAFTQKQGAQGFIGKDAGAEQIVSAIRRVAQGLTHFPDASRSGQDARDALAALSGREREVLSGMLQGKSQIEIANQLGITNKSVGTYRTRILEKTGVGSNAELIALATRIGLV